MVMNAAKCFIPVVAGFLFIVQSTFGGDVAELTPDELVQQLGDDSYTARSEAAEELRARGVKSEQALLNGLKSKDAEIHTRCIRLLGWIAHDVREKKLAEFIQGKPGPFNLPGWGVIQKNAGDSTETRKFYARLFREFESELLDFETADEDSALENATHLSEWLSTDKLSGESVDPPLLVAIVLMACSDKRILELRGGTSFRGTMQLYSILSRTNVKQIINDKKNTKVLKGLVAHWVMQNSESTYGGYAIKIGMSYGLREPCLQASRKMLTAKASSNSATPYAMLTIARFGETADAKYLEPFLTKNQTCHTWSNSRLSKKLIRTQTRDVALAVSIHLNGEDPADYGFNYLQRNDDTVFAIYCMGFTEDHEREAAHKKWQMRDTFEEPPAP